MFVLVVKGKIMKYVLSKYQDIFNVVWMRHIVEIGTFDTLNEAKDKGKQVILGEILKQIAIKCDWQKYDLKGNLVDEDIDTSEFPEDVVQIRSEEVKLNLNEFSLIIEKKEC